jgi:hypothetical protein
LSLPIRLAWRQYAFVYASRLDGFRRYAIRCASSHDACARQYLRRPLGPAEFDLQSIRLLFQDAQGHRLFRKCPLPNTQ